MALCEACQPAYILEDDYEFSGDDYDQLLFDPDPTIACWSARSPS
ncbi:hypothetical protein ACU8V3_01770 [Cobetia marina]